VKKLIERFLIFLAGVPLVSLLILRLPQKNHLALNLLTVVLSSLGAVEFAGILRRKGLPLPGAEAALLGGLAPLSVTLAVSFGLGAGVAPVLLILGASWLLVSRVFAPEGKFGDFAAQAAAGFSVMMYPGFFMAWVAGMSRWPGAGAVILVFFFTTCANDSAAWAAGMLFGKNNRGIIPASPNKSVAGFIGGFAASMLAGALAAFFLPGPFSSSRLPSPAAGMILGFATALAGSLGDLGESVLKRSVGIKDSGSLVPGRGGVLDTIDSIALAAPVYYGLYWLLFYSA
jgi:phosphatidate cytidylyltransferase